MSDITPERSKKLTRQVKRHLNDDRAESVLAEHAKNLGAGIEAEIVRNLPVLLAQIDKTYSEYEDKLNLTIRSLEVSSREQNDLNNRLANLNATINAMLDGLGQGLVFFDCNGICSDVYSKACLDFLGTSPGGKNLADILQLDDRQREDFQSWLSVVFETTAALDFADLKSLAPSEFINFNKRYIELDYRPIETGDAIKAGILLIATDRTVEREAAGRLLQIQNESRTILNIARRRNEFWRFIDNLQAFIKSIRDTGFRAFDRDDLMRGLHTYKGLAQFFALNDLSALLHTAEGCVEQGWQNDDNETLLYTQLDEIERQTGAALTAGQELFGADFFGKGQVRTVDYKVLMDFQSILESRLAQIPAGAEVLNAFNSLLLAVPAVDCFQSFSSELGRIAETQGKPAPKIVFINGDLPIVMKTYETFFDSLIHLARNIIDHGIETPSRRRQKGKADSGTVTIEVNCNNGLYTFILSDDGQGFQVEKIRKRLQQGGDPEADFMTDAAAIQKIFDPAFSTLNAATVLSGRGVGLSAIKTAMENLGGHAEAQIAENGGARFVFHLPSRLPGIPSAAPA